MCKKCVRKNISINESIWDGFVKYCERENYKYSNKLEEMIRNLLDKNGLGYKKNYTKAEREQMEYEIADII